MERTTSWRSPEAQELVTLEPDGSIYLETPDEDWICFAPWEGEPRFRTRVPGDDEPLPPAPEEPDARALLVRQNGVAALLHFTAARERLRRLRGDPPAA